MIKAGNSMKDKGELMVDCIFLIGPGGAGKSTVGKLLAEQLGYVAIDVDDVFCARIANIREYIKSRGYESYLELNSTLLRTLQVEYAGHNRLFILSSGFLSTDIRPDIVETNRKMVSEQGFSVLLMPSQNYTEALGCIINRQLNRGFGLVREKEELKFSQRFDEYSQMGDLKIFSMQTPELIAAKIVDELATRSA
jgi:shikimate kinase